MGKTTRSRVDCNLGEFPANDAEVLGARDKHGVVELEVQHGLRVGAQPTWYKGERQDGEDSKVKGLRRKRAIARKGARRENEKGGDRACGGG